MHQAALVFYPEDKEIDDPSIEKSNFFKMETSAEYY